LNSELPVCANGFVKHAKRVHLRRAGHPSAIQKLSPEPVAGASNIGTRNKKRHSSTKTDFAPTVTMAVLSRQRGSQRRDQSKYVLFALAVLVIFWLISFACLVLSWRGNTIGTDPIEKALRNHKKAKTPESRILSRFSNVTATSDVRGNLGPASVVIQQDPGKDWIKDRWQAASNMHGTAIKGTHWVLLDFGTEIVVDEIVLDWEAAYADKYRLEGSLVDPGTDNADVWTLFDGTNSSQEDLRSTVKSGQSPGVKTKTPLHIVHTIHPIREKKPLRYLRVFILKSAMGWGGKIVAVSFSICQAILRLTIHFYSQSRSGNLISMGCTRQRWFDNF
jgi:hypothetical protein